MRRKGATHVDVVCVHTLVTGAAEHQVVGHLRERKTLNSKRRGGDHSTSITDNVMYTYFELKDGYKAAKLSLT